MSNEQVIALIAAVLMPTLLGFWAGYLCGRSVEKDVQRSQT